MNKYNELIHKLNIYGNLELFPLEIEGNNICQLVKEHVLAKIKNEKPIIIEVGTWKGASAIEMARFYKKRNQDPTVFCVDTWNGSGFHRSNDFWQNQLRCKNGYPQIYYQFLSNIVHNNLQDNIVPIPLNSVDGARFLSGEYLKELKIKADLIYIDACHEYSDVLRDIISYFQLLKDDGILFGDDYDSGWPGVVSAVNEFVLRNNLEKRFINIRSQWVINSNG